MAFLKDYARSLTDFDLARYLEKVKVCGVDPYEVNEEECSEEISLWPAITELDRNDYFVYQTNFVSKEAMKCMKALEAHTFFTSGLVFRPKVKELNSELVLVLGKVKHSQSFSLEPLKCWLLAKKDGCILTCHCTCMAGRGEACSHVAAVVFLLEHAVKLRDGQACTDQLNSWLPPTLKTVPLKRTSEMDFSSPKARLMKMAKLSSGPEENPIPSRSTSNLGQCSKPAKEALKSVLDALALVQPRAAVLSASLDHCEKFIPPTISDELPKLMSELYDPQCEQMRYQDLLIRCKSVIQDVCASATKDNVTKVESLTRGQASSDIWFKFRQGRITASNMKLVCRGDIDRPARSTINAICYGGKQILSPDVQRGKLLEPVARAKYTQLQEKHHSDLCVEECGLFINEEHAFLAASPDGIITCSCCEGPGGLEIKCPREENVSKCFDSDGHLLRDHQYFYQVQTQMFVCDLSYCDIFIFNRARNILQRVLPDKECHQEILEKSQQYFIYVILPELIAKHFSLNRPPLAPSNLSLEGQSTVICYCQTPRRPPVVICAGENCTFSEFHCRCVNLTTAPKKKWFCDQCKQK